MTPNHNYTKTPYTQYFCSENEGMKLRSGTVINCIKKSPLYDDLLDLLKKRMTLPPLHEGEDGVYEFSTWHSHNCSSIIEQLRFIERHHETLLREPILVGLYKQTLNTLNNWIRDIESGSMKCECWHYHSWRVTEGACMLTPEYDYLSSLDHHDYHNIKSNKNITYSSRMLYRLYRNNFIVSTEEEDVYGVSVKKHDYSLILDELQLWRRYFRKEPLVNIKAAYKALNKTKIVSDCIGKVLEFL